MRHTCRGHLCPKFIIIQLSVTSYKLYSCVPRPAPSPVQGLQLTSSSSDSLGVSWQAGPGRTEQFRVLLSDQDGVLLKNITLQNTVTSTRLDGLQPGTLYTVTVVTEAAGLQSSASERAVTGRCYDNNSV